VSSERQLELFFEHPSAPLAKMRKSLEDFGRVDVPLIVFVRGNQVDVKGHLGRVGTMATFFSAVTATTLQMTWNVTPQTPLIVAGSVCYLVALFFSASAAVYSFLLSVPESFVYG
jgi:hypothetical protein